MKASMQNRISPADNTSKSMDFSSAADNNRLQKKGGLDFKDILIKSNRDIQQNRKDKPETLEQFNNYDSYLKDLQRKTNGPRKPKGSLDKDDFLKLFITQLQNQDPLKPKDGSEMASQLAQFNGLEQMMNVNNSLKRVEEKISQQKDLNTLVYLGKHITVNNGKVQFDGQSNTAGEVKLAQPSKKTVLSVLDKQGKTIYTEDLGFRKAGAHPIEWNGKTSKNKTAPAGTYTILVESIASDEKKTATELPVETYTKVTGLNLNNADSFLQTEVGNLSLAEVNEVKVAPSKIGAKPEVAKNPPPIMGLGGEKNNAEQKVQKVAETIQTQKPVPEELLEQGKAPDPTALSPQTQRPPSPSV